MFRNRNQLLGWKLANGQHVEARVLVTLYEARGDFQLNVETMRQAGTGNLFERFQKLKARLEAEGLFAAERKRPLPAFPRTVGIVTSLQAAALRDVLATLTRRAPQVAIVLFPTPVQGEGAGAQIAAAIDTAGASGHCDALIVCRGGGSIEDLWAFNDEAVARAMRACPIPVISGVGHETDFTIADFVADLRAPTPTAAAELVAQPRAVWLGALDLLGERLQDGVQRQIDLRGQRLDHLTLRLGRPSGLAAREQQRLSVLHGRLRHAVLFKMQRLTQSQQAVEAQLPQAMQRHLAAQEERLARCALRLDLLAPQRVLERGYAILCDAQGHTVTSVQQAHTDDTLQAQLPMDGWNCGCRRRTHRRDPHRRRGQSPRPAKIRACSYNGLLTRTPPAGAGAAFPTTEERIAPWNTLCPRCPTPLTPWPRTTARKRWNTTTASTTTPTW